MILLQAVSNKEKTWKRKFKLLDMLSKTPNSWSSKKSQILIPTHTGSMPIPTRGLTPSRERAVTKETVRMRTPST